MATCPYCSNEVEKEWDVCPGCQKWNQECRDKIKLLINQGHTRHCACRMVWDDGECECDLKSRDIREVLAAIKEAGI